jgi:hypothetical protein
MSAVKLPLVRILIIDDDEDDFFITSEYLKQIQEYQLQIDWCYKYNDAIQHLKESTTFILSITGWVPEQVWTF